MNGMNIAFFGSSLVSAFWNGAATYYRGIINELHKMGHTITFYEPDAYDRQKHRDIEELDYAASVVYPATDEGVARALEMAKNAEIIIKTSGVGVYDEYLERTVLRFKENGKIVAFWDVDAPVTLNRIADNPDDPFTALVGKYDLIFTYGGGEPVVNGYLNAGAKECIPIYNALDPKTHFPVRPNPKFEAALGFLGNRLPDREIRVKEFFFKPATRMPEAKMMLGGNGWDQNIAQLENVNIVGHVYTHEHNAFNSTPMAVLNINRQSMAEYGFSPATRVFEAAGAGACIITDAWQGIELFLEPGKECLVAQNSENVIEHLRTLNYEKAKMIGDAARRRILGEHTYVHRSHTVETILLTALENRKEVVR